MKKRKRDRMTRQNKEVNAIRFAPKVCEVAQYNKESTNTNDEERQNRNIKGCSGVNRYMFEALAV
jgi:hypothetical protein